jgi:hypothetical protein
MDLKVIGTGLSRTGTTTLRKVLEVLGFGPCYNSSELFTHPQHIEFWEALERGEEVDFDAFFADYGAIIGFPGYIFAQQLLKKYPDAKIILSYRDAEEWYDDISATVFQNSSNHVNKQYAEAVKEFDPYLSECIIRIHALQDRILEKGYFEGRFEDKTYAVERYKQYNEEVKQTFPPEKLLVYQVTEGWEPICDFLGVPVPEDEPFPHLNHKDVFHKRSSTGFLEALKKSESI